MTRISTPARDAVLDDPLDQVVADLGVVDQQLLPRPPDERGQELARGLRADDEPVVAAASRAGACGRLRTARSASRTMRLSLRDDAEAAALLDIDLGVVEAEDVQRAVDDHHLAVVARQVVGRARDGDAGVEQPHLELPQALLAALVGVRDERADEHAALDGRSAAPSRPPARSNRKITMSMIFFARRIAFTSGVDAVVRLDDQLHGSILLLVLLFFPLDRQVPVRIELQEPVRDIVGLDLERHVDLVADLLVGCRCAARTRGCRS